MTRVIHVCVDRPVPPEKAMEAAAKAIEENPLNAPMSRPRMGFGLSPSEPLRMALVTEKRWKIGRTLRVRFIDGEPQVQAKVKQYAVQWSQHANVRFEFVATGDAEIRIAFRPEEGSWSRLGTDALVFPQSQWTMNFGWLTPTTPDVEYSRVVIHEFGHALSCIHEHQNPIARIPWDKPGVYAYYARQGWPKADVDHNVFQAYSRDLTQFTEFDPKSIMLYAVPNELTVGDFEIGWNASLSDTDKLFIDTMYPSTSKPEIDLQVGGLAVQESIGKHGEEDLFGFSASVKGGYTLETQGRTDVIMALYGPDSRTALLAEDDDSGQGRNAKISQFLQPGTYYVRIRHYRPTRTGEYKISVKTVP